MILPDSVIGIVAGHVDTFPNDITAAVEASVADIRKLPDYETLIDQLLGNAVRSCAHDIRHTRNVRTRNSSGFYATAQKRSISVANSESVKEAFRSVYGYYIAGKQLGDVTGEELEPIAASERSRAEGHIFNARLADWLTSQGVKGKKRVRDVVSEKKLVSQFNTLMAKSKTDAA